MLNNFHKIKYFLGDLSIKNKLRIIILLTSSIVLLLASIAFVAHDLLIFRRHMVSDLFVLTDLVGFTNLANISFNHQKVVEDHLSALKVHPHIILAHIFDRNGHLLASYYREERHPLPKPANLLESFPKQDNYLFHNNYLEVFRIIQFKDNPVGIIYLQSDLKAFNQRLFWTALIMGNVLLVSLLLAFILASKFQQVITVPMNRLLETTTKVSLQKNYSLRTPERIFNDELGHLVSGFNKMLDQIEKRDNQLSMYRDHLEEMVDQRTAELIQKTAELAEARDQALAANQAKSTFLANMSHELRTPLNGILGYTQILNRDKSLTTQQREGLNVIQRSGEYLLTLISDILDLSKIEAGKIELHPMEFHFGQFLKSIAELFQMRAAQKNITFIYEFSKELPIGINADEIRLRQILINLLSNAIKFTKSEGNVMFNVEKVENKIRFAVADTGIGIAPEDLPKIFLPFQQVGDVKYKTEGTGLGLAISKTLIEKMGGTLNVDSILGEGSTFWMDLDLPIAFGEIVATELTNKPMIIGYQSVKKYKILVVDDKWENRSIIYNFLAPLGFEILEANDGQEGVEKAIKMHPDVILMDLMMPRMNGFDATRQIRGFPEMQKMIILAASASVFGHHRQESLAAGCNDFIHKPIREEILLEQLQKYLNLTWIYEPSELAASIQLPELPPPQAKHLYDSIIMGDLNSILEQVEFLEQLGDPFVHFGEKIRDLATNCDLPGLRQLITQSLEKSLQMILWPSGEWSKNLHELVIMGDISGILEQAEQLKQMDKKFEPLANKIQKLANYLDITGLLELTKPTLESVNKPTDKHEELNTQMKGNLPKEEIIILHSLAMMGDIEGIFQKIEQFEQTGQQFIPLVVKVRELANNFEVAQLRDLTKHYTENL